MTPKTPPKRERTTFRERIGGLNFRIPEGTREVSRKRCPQCLHPVAVVDTGTRRIQVNADGTPHRGACPAPSLRSSLRKVTN